MKFLLDTNICIYIIKKRPPKVYQKFRSLTVGDVGISVITLSELQFGVEKSQHSKQNQAALNEFLLPLVIADYTRESAIAYGQLRTQLTKTGKPIGPLDMLIGAHALSLKIPLVTNNLREFRRIKGLKVVNWV